MVSNIVSRGRCPSLLSFQLSEGDFEHFFFLDFSPFQHGSRFFFLKLYGGSSLLHNKYGPSVLKNYFLIDLAGSIEMP